MVRPYLFDFLIHEYSSSGSVGRNIFIYISMNLIKSHELINNPKEPRENLSCSISTWSLSLQSRR